MSNRATQQYLEYAWVEPDGRRATQQYLEYAWVSASPFTVRTTQQYLEYAWKPMGGGARFYAWFTN